MDYIRHLSDLVLRDWVHYINLHWHEFERGLRATLMNRAKWEQHSRQTRKPMRDKLLKLIGYTEPTTFNELCDLLGTDIPCEKSQWRELFEALKDAEAEGLIDVHYTKDRKVDMMQLTEEGAAYVRDKL